MFAGSVNQSNSSSSSSMSPEEINSIQYYLSFNVQYLDTKLAGANVQAARNNDSSNVIKHSYHSK